MKKWTARIAVALMALAVLLAVVLALYINSIVRTGVVSIGSKIANVRINLSQVNLSLFSGKGRITGLVAGNPEGYKNTNSIKANSITISVKPASVFGDTILVHSIIIHDPEITFEGSLKENNLSQILARIEAFADAEKKPAQPGEQRAKRIQVGDFLMSGGKIHTHLAGRQETTVALPEVHLADLGTVEQGLAAGDLAQRIFKDFCESATKAVAVSLSNTTTNMAGSTTNKVKSALEGAVKATNNVGDLIKK